CSPPLVHLYPPSLFNATTPTGTYTLSLHDALPISSCAGTSGARGCAGPRVRRRAAEAICRIRKPAADDRGLDSGGRRRRLAVPADRKSTRLNSSHVKISYAVFCLKKKTGTSLGCRT